MWVLESMNCIHSVHKSSSMKAADHKGDMLCNPSIVFLSCSKGHLIALDIIRGLVFLHSNKVVHADLKAKNVLLTQNAGELHPL